MYLLGPVILYILYLAGYFKNTSNEVSIESQQGQIQVAIQIGALQIQKYSDEVIGILGDLPIHDFIVAKYQARDEWKTYYFKEPILKDEEGRLILRMPESNQVFTQTGMVYELRD